MIIGARDPARAAAVRAAAGDRAMILPLDLADLGSVARFVTAVAERLGPDRAVRGIACNAGVQVVGPKRLTDQGVELTFAANHLGHFALVQGLMDRLAPGGIVVSTGSGTHHPDDRMARLFGFRGAVVTSWPAVAAGDLDPSAPAARQGMDRYATSKLCTLLFTRAMAERVAAEKVRFAAFDPGLMPGTGLARDRSALERFGWRYVLPALAPFLDGVSTPEASAAALAVMLTAAPATLPTGSYRDHHGRPASRSPDADRADWADALYDLSQSLVAASRPATA